MSDKYVVSKEFMNALEEWKDNLRINGKYQVCDYDIRDLPVVVDEWWCPVDIQDYEQNNRLIAILRWVNGEDVFEIEKPKKWVVRSKETDEGGHYGYVKTTESGIPLNRYYIDTATKFDTKEEAESWANAHQEVIEVEG